MIRIKISIDENEYCLAQKEAKALRISVSELVRRALRQALPTSREMPWMRYAGILETGDPRSSQSIDEVTYGEKD